MTHDRFVLRAGEVRPGWSVTGESVSMSRKLSSGPGWPGDRPVHRYVAGLSYAASGRGRARHGPGRRPESSCGYGQIKPSGRKTQTRDREARDHPAASPADFRCTGQHRKTHSRPPRRKPRQALHLNRSIAFNQPCRSRNGSGDVNRRAESGRRFGDRHLVPARLEFQKRLGTQKAEPSDLFATDHTFKQKRGRRPFDAAEMPKPELNHRPSIGGIPGMNEAWPRKRQTLRN